MAKPFDLKKQLKLHDKGLLRRLFVDRFQVLADVPWDGLRPHEVDPIIEGWPGISEHTRQELEVVLQDVNKPSDERSQKVLVEDLDWRCPDKREAFAGWKCLHDKALWAYLEVPDGFDEAARRSRACAYLADDDHGPLALQEIALVGCPTVGVRTGTPFIQDGVTGVFVDRLPPGAKCVKNDADEVALATFLDALQSLQNRERQEVRE